MSNSSYNGIKDKKNRNCPEGERRNCEQSSERAGGVEKIINGNNETIERRQ